ncbi:glucose-6-phosphate isomerase [Lysinibacillus sp. KU-BSD001]|uniref:glucose-6-phosphate isomerase n=1 Tax=Lysinibacillus sp. KU-BSD001 TaxID=3141328 RepID=UPI0036EA8CB3
MSSDLIKLNFSNVDMLDKEWCAYQAKVDDIHHHLEQLFKDSVGWIGYPLQNQSVLLQQITNIANEIREHAEILVVIGVGGSYLGARAIQDALTPYFKIKKGAIEVVYVGQNLSGAYIAQLLDYLADKNVYVNVISKSGTTMETALAFRVLKQYMDERYGIEAIERIIVTTDAENGLLKEIADHTGYRQFIIPANIGGRYSVLTPVGLLPVAVAGIDIDELINGAKHAAMSLNHSRLERNNAYCYAVFRHFLYEQGYKVELLASFEPSLKNFHEWWMQLFGESEGKERKGLFPSAASYSTDLHAIGQFIQEGNPILFETLLYFEEVQEDVSVPYDTQNDDRLNYLSNRTFNEMNNISRQGTALAHIAGGVPVIQLQLPKLDAYHIGYLIYFFMKACAMSACLLGVNPFNQPGVEAYKNKMLALLQKIQIVN